MAEAAADPSGGQEVTTLQFLSDGLCGKSGTPQTEPSAPASGQGKGALAWP